MPSSPAPLLSLIIPTRERAETLAFTLATALEQQSRDYEIIVSDNASADHTKAVVDKLDDARIHYFNTGQRLSMCGNYEFALERCGWVGTWRSLVDRPQPGGASTVSNRSESSSSLRMSDAPAAG